MYLLVIAQESVVFDLARLVYNNVLIEVNLIRVPRCLVSQILNVLHEWLIPLYGYRTSTLFLQRAACGIYSQRLSTDSLMLKYSNSCSN